jgi:hypothetical protein
VLGQALGLTHEEYAAMQGDYRNSSLFSERDKAVLRWSEAMTRNTARQDDDAFRDMQGHFRDVEIVEISMACALFNMGNRLNDAFRTELEPEEYNRRQHGAVGVTEKALIDYACRICRGGSASRGLGEASSSRT